MPWRLVFLLLFAVADVARVPSFGRAQPAEVLAPYVVGNSEVECWTGQQLASAIADPTVHTAVMMRDVKLADDDFAAAQQPGGLIVIQRNLTIRGVNSNWPTLFNLNYLLVKVQLVGDMTLRLENLFLVNYRRGSATQQPGFDFLTAARDTAGNVPIVEMVECYILYKYCFPPKTASESFRFAQRPAEVPGNNTFKVPYPLPSVCTSADAVQQQQLAAPPPTLGSPDGGPWSSYGCFQQAVLLIDVAVKGGDMDDNGSPLANSTAYPVHALNTIGLCINVLTMQCINILGPLGCLLYTMAPPGKSATPPPAAAPLPTAGGHRRLPVILGASIGGGFALLLIGAAAVGGAVVAWKRRRLAEWRHDEEANTAATSKRPTEGPPANDVLYGPVGSCSDETLVALAEEATTPVAARTANRQHQGPCHAALFPTTSAAGPFSTAPAPLLLLPADGPSDTGQVLLGGNEGSRQLPAASGALGVTQQGDAAAMAAVAAARVAADGSIHLLEAGIPRSGEGTLAASSAALLAPLQRPASRDDPDPVTPLTPLQPGINLDVVLDGTEVKLSGVTLGKGAFGRVVEGLYCGQLVAVKIIDHGLLCTSQPLDPHVTAVGLAGAAEDNKQVAVREEGRSGGGGLGGGGAATSALGRVPEEILAGPLGNRPPTTADCSAAAGEGGLAVDDGASSSSSTPPTAPAATRFTRRSSSDTGTAGGGAAVAAPVTAAGCSSSASDVMNSNGQSTFPCVSSSKGKATDTAAVTTTATALEDEEEEQQGQVAVAEDAMQQPHPQSPRIAELESTLKQEVEVLARCQHPNIVRLLAACLRPPRYCLVMELMETSLERLLYDEQRTDVGLLPLDMVLNIATQIAQGLAYLHPTVVHRDLKPANVLISHAHQGRPAVKLADFGLSRLRDTVLITRNPEVGTAPYISPEAFDVYNQRITDRVDVYALGIILWEMLSGRRPWSGVNIVVIALNVSMYRRRPPLDAVPRSRCPAQLRALIEACWDHVPERRPASAEVAKRLVLIRQEEERHARSHVAGLT